MMDGRNRLEEVYTPTVLQNAIGNPLRSERRARELLPRVLSRLDMLTIFIAIILFIPNASIVKATQAVGISTYLDWIVGAVTFLIPGALVSGQLNRFMPVEGSIYVWTHRALGPLWGFFGAVCAWFPGVLVMLAISVSTTTLLQGISIQIWGSTPGWLATSWQQSIVVLIILLLTGWLATFPLSLLMKWAKGIIALYGIAILVIGLAGAIWLFQGHAPQVPLTISTEGFGEESIAWYGVIVLAMLGIEVPLNMTAETNQPGAPKLFLRWGPLIALVAYLLSTFGVMMVVPPIAAGTSYSMLIAVNLVFGVPGAVLVGLSFIAFSIIAVILYNLTFARILFVAALDYRLPIPLARVNRHAVPSWATGTQTILVLIIAILIYFVVPLLYPQQGAVFSARAYNIIQATVTIIWCISMVILFLDLPILLVRFRRLLARSSSLLITSPWLLHLCCLVGGVASLMGIWTTLRSSWDSHLISDTQWRLTIGIATVIFLIIGLISAAYPRVLSNIEEQTAIARENARLYLELQAAYSKLRELDQLKDAFLTTASHELRTPLTIVQGYLELLKLMGDASLDEQRTFITRACRACDELVVLLANVMDASRLRLDAAPLHTERIMLKSTTLVSVDLFEPLISREQRNVTIDIDESIVVLADEARLKQILHNLISNALRYSPPKTPIQIVASVEEGQMVRVSVSDQGSGIPPDKQLAIFDKFVRLERDMHGEVRGSGLGLFITRQLVEAMNGTVRVDSSGILNEGSTFSFTLRLAMEC